MEIAGIAQEGLRRAEAKLERAAERVSRPEGSDSVALSESAVELIEARNLYEANLKLVKTAEQMQKHILDVLG